MTKPITRRSRREFITKASQHLKSIRAALVHEVPSEDRAGRSGNGGGSLDSGDLASQELQQHMNAILSERERERVVEVDHALKRMAEANYGVCEACGLEIAEARLKALPLARRCRDCQNDQEREAKARYRGADFDRERLREFTSNPVEDEISEEPMQRSRNETSS
jgi:RNA polymerase-binding protein DksA